MPYTEEQLAECDKDPQKAWIYYWHVMLNCRRIAARYRTKGEADKAAHMDRVADALFNYFLFPDKDDE
jgi:hypothetical protein